MNKHKFSLSMVNALFEKIAAHMTKLYSYFRYNNALFAMIDKRLNKGKNSFDAEKLFLDV